ncbi:inhibitor of nuclear factor kappa-B kinase subunit alpha-like isoform X1 [Frieseomelitta varia]|uniref:inhibitor of nuclear factor kappa-B kinase subunit alpha-like isoform X1 n=1 Tax=Frieseomelitta varia TaxID=561572 RepID=UPI001CB68DE2|nr:inhibitor of nuclear factor kappa-B kinase subunit alpha-like isoform X1 [Frieseomelitta varia]XP_043511348.1 inhibitor of nuclear factor kappa-B kinase subunit alpha-like isoform X1 [Frieseomelitta varia]XP_043511349.1 inhibitor of nuclear factor kappa-B kinase subunit alpha-like isoform X1 [Frieseomelitta varia]
MTAIPVHIEGWSLNKILGSGGFGIVELWTHESGKKIAIKICKRDVKQLKETQRKRWIHEVQIMKRLKHPNIVKGLDLPFKHPDDKVDLPLLCMEFCSKGDLRKILKKTENCCGVSEKEAINVMKNISSAVEYLHSNNITHRDLKPENIVLQDEYNIISYKLIDLGYAKELGEDSTSGSLVGTLNYIAPELLWKLTYSCSVDYWSLGILFYELITGTRPFLPKMQHTMSWMQHIKNKKYDDICAFKSKGKIVFAQDIVGPTNLSNNLRNKLVQWFKVVLQWDPKKRGKQHESGVTKLVVFELLHSILSKQIVYVFAASMYKTNAYEVDSTTKITDLQSMIEKDTNIPLNQQTLTDYFGKVLIENQIPLLSQIQDSVLFVFKNESPLKENIPMPVIPIEIQKMVKLPKNQLDFETLQDYYKVSIFFVNQEINLFRLFFFALTIKVDLVITRLDTFNKDIINTLININKFLNEVSTVCNKWKEEYIDKEKLTALEINYKKVTKLVKAADQIKLKFDLLIQESSKLNDAVKSIDYIKDMFQIYNKITEIYELHKDEYSHKDIRPTEVAKLIFEFLKIQGEQFCNIFGIIKQVAKLESKLRTLEMIFNSVIALKTVYCEDFQNITQRSLDNISNEKCLKNETTNILSNIEVSNEFNSNQSLNMSNIKHQEMMDVQNDVIYDNLIIRYTLDNLLMEMQNRYMDLLSLEL